MNEAGGQAVKPSDTALMRVYVEVTGANEGQAKSVLIHVARREEVLPESDPPGLERRPGARADPAGAQGRRNRAARLDTSAVGLGLFRTSFGALAFGLARYLTGRRKGN